MYVVLCGYCVAGTSEQEEWIGTVNKEYAIIYTVEEVYSLHVVNTVMIRMTRDTTYIDIECMHEEKYGTIYNTTTLCYCTMIDRTAYPSKRIKFSANRNT